MNKNLLLKNNPKEDNNQNNELIQINKLLNDEIYKIKKKCISIIKKIGKGYFGIIYLAKYDNQHIALKVIKLEKKEQTVFDLNKKMIVYEMNTHMNLHHLNIIKSFLNISFMNENLNYFVIFQYLANFKDLSNFIYSLQKKNIYNLTNNTNKFKFLFYLSENSIKFIIKQIFLGLFCLHEHNIIHCDIKPSNILIHNFIMMITDFSIIVPLQKTKYTYINFGTKIYSPIESYFRETLTCNVFKVDYFGIGCIIFELLTKEVLINMEIEQKTKDKYIVFNKIIYERINNLKNLNRKKGTNYSKKFIDFVIGLIIPDPSLRFGFKEIIQNLFINNDDKIIKNIYSINRYEKGLKLFIELQKDIKNLNNFKKRRKYIIN